MSNYGSTISYADEITLTIDRGNVTACAVSRGSYEDVITGETYTVYGTSPKAMDKEDFKIISSLQEALKYA